MRSPSCPYPGRLLVAAAAAAALVAVAACQPDPPPDADDAPREGSVVPHAAGFTPEFHPDEGCFGHGPKDGGRVRCGYVTAPADHDDPDGETIRLAVAVLPATDPGAGDDPVVMLQGGPGGHLVEPALAVPEQAAPFEIGPETILIDQRGVGLSEPALECPGFTEVFERTDAETEAVTTAGVEALAACHDELVADGVDPGHYTTPANAADVDLVRRALGYERVHIRAVSYGTEVALLAAGAHPDRVRSLVLSSPVDPAANWIAEAPASFERAMDELTRACDADAGCAARFDDLRAGVDQALAPLAAQPVDTRVRRSDGTIEQLAYTAEAAIGHLRWLLYLPPAVGPERVPGVIAEAVDGDYTSLATLGSYFEGEAVTTISHGLYHAVRCSGDAADLAADDLRAHATWDAVANHLVPAEAALLEVCDHWDVDPAGEPGEADLSPDVPALIVTGRLDPVTPPHYGEQVAARLPDTVLVEVSDAGHGPLEVLTDCGREIAAAFVADPGHQPDTDCATDRALEPTVELEPVLTG